jgi:hypothetical protein
VLAEQARHMLSPRRQAVVKGGGDQHLDNRLAALALPLGIVIGPLHVRERWGNDDAGGMVISGFSARGTAKLGNSESATFGRLEWLSMSGTTI